MAKLPLLEETFGILNEGYNFKVQLHSDQLVVLQTKETVLVKSSTTWSWFGFGGVTVVTDERDSVFKKIDLSSVIGCHVSGAGDNERAFLTLYSYTKENLAPKSSPTPRRRQKVTLYYDPVAIYDRSLDLANRWRVLVRYLISGRNLDQGLITSFIAGKISELPCLTKRLLIILNPVCGSGNSEQMFRETVETMLQEADIDYKLLTTEYSGHGKVLIAREANLAKYDGIVTASGDGLFHEVINGLLSRSDWEQALRVPLGVLPVGSANALATMICKTAGEATSGQLLYQATFLLTKSITPKPFDLMAIDTVQGRLYSPMWVAWGIISDIDIESEDLRFLGATRFSIETLLRVCLLRRYRGRLSFLPAAAVAGNQEGASLIPPLKAAEVVNKSDGIDDADKMSVVLMETPLLPKSLADPVPKNWTTIEDDFIGLVAMRCSHLASDVLVNPSITADDGAIWIMVARASTCSRRLLMKMFRDMGQGQGVANTPGIEWHRALAFRLEPEPRPASSPGTRGYILTVDGEKIPYGPVQAQILPKASLLI